MRPAEHRRAVETMADRLVHRGPDDRSLWSDGRATLGHTRLSIIDLIGGAQPLTSEDGRMVLIYNGEIYNFRELRAELEAAGHHFRSRTDGECVVHLYEESGTDCLTRLRGMFAFALYDARAGSVLLARDRMGQKPLVYRLLPDAIAFASELAALAAMDSRRPALDLAALDDYLAYGYVPEPRTIYQGIGKLPPAHALVWRDGSARVFRYWSVDEHPPREDLEEAEASELLRAKLTEAVRLRLVSDVPLGAFLSGGLDSSIVVALMAQLSQTPVRTFSVGFEEAAYSELPFARAVAQRHHTQHTEFTVRPENLEILGRLVRHFGEPFADSSAIPTWQVAQVTAGQVKVALSGDGGDELFSGYERYEAVRVAGKLHRNPAMRWLFAPGWWKWLGGGEQKGLRTRLRRFAESVPLADFERYLAYVSVFAPHQKAALLRPETLRSLGDHDASTYLRRAWDRFASCDLSARAARTDLVTYLPGDLLTKVDITSMANSLEVRSPFMDHELVELAVRIPTAMKREKLRGKRILRRTFADLLPEEVLNRRKQGFAIPVGRWFRGSLGRYLEETILAPDARIAEYVRPEAVRGLVAEHLQERGDFGGQIWALLMLELWHREFM